MTLLPQVKLNTKYLWSEFEEEVKRLNHLKGIIYKQSEEIINLSPHRSKNTNQSDLSESESQMLQSYLLHILQFGTPEERLKILSGIKSKFELTKSKLELK